MIWRTVFIFLGALCLTPQSRKTHGAFQAHSQWERGTTQHLQVCRGRGTQEDEVTGGRNLISKFGHFPLDQKSRVSDAPGGQMASHVAALSSCESCLLPGGSSHLGFREARNNPTTTPSHCLTVSFIFSREIWV